MDGIVAWSTGPNRINRARSNRTWNLPGLPRDSADPLAAYDVNRRIPDEFKHPVVSGLVIPHNGLFVDLAAYADDASPHDRLG